MKSMAINVVYWISVESLDWERQENGDGAFCGVGGGGSQFHITFPVEQNFKEFANLTLLRIPRSSAVCRSVAKQKRPLLRFGTKIGQNFAKEGKDQISISKILMKKKSIRLLKYPSQHLG